MEYLKKHQVPTLIHYPLCIHKQEAFSKEKAAKTACPQAQRYAHELVSLPIHPFLNKEEVLHVAHTVCGFFQKQTSGSLKKK